jgi:hypothetical protein
MDYPQGERAHHEGPLVGANDCKCSRDQRLSVPSEARNKQFLCYFNLILNVTQIAYVQLGTKKCLHKKIRI